MRHDAQRSMEEQDLLPADEALYGFRSQNFGTGMLNALRQWEKRRGIQPAFTPRNRQQKPTKPARVKKTREELLARKREVARLRWANMPADKKQAAKERIWAWAAAKKTSVGAHREEASEMLLHSQCRSAEAGQAGKEV